MGTQEPHWIDDDAECPNCGCEGTVYECFDGCCEDAEWGCEDCARPCECQKRQALSWVEREVLRKATTKAGDQS